ncbi:hypothetical protein R3I94_008071 [Phoxinus phoxinus]
MAKRPPSNLLKDIIINRGDHRPALYD